MKFSARQIRHPYLEGTDVLDALRDAAVELGTGFVDWDVEKEDARGGNPLECFALSSPREDFEDALQDNAVLWDNAIEAFLRDHLAEGEPTDGLEEVVSEELSRLYPLTLAAALARRDEQMERYTPPHAGESYRELLAAAGVPDTEHNLFELGQWLGDEGARAEQFPDATPENMPGWDFPIDFLEDRDGDLDQEEE